MYNNIKLKLNNYKMNWISDSVYIKGFTSSSKPNSDKFAIFDLDHTLIKPHNDRTFPKDHNDWILFNSNIPNILQDYEKKGYSIIIITNQTFKTKDKIDNFKIKIDNISKVLKVSFIIYILYQKNVYRKPFPTLLSSFNYNKELSFYCGDAAGRLNNYKNKKDFSDTDYKFALNCKLKFITPEFLFMNINDKDQYSITYPNYNQSKTFDIKTVLSEIPNKLILIIMIGYPGCGKSELSKHLSPNKYIILNNDTIRSKKKINSQMKNALIQKQSIVIDNTNMSISERHQWIEYGQKHNYYIIGIFFDGDMDVAYHRNCYRAFNNHIQKSITISKIIPRIAYYILRKKFNPPTKNEGFHQIITIPYPNISDDNYLYYFFLACL